LDKKTIYGWALPITRPKIHVFHDEINKGIPFSFDGMPFGVLGTIC